MSEFMNFLLISIFLSFPEAILVVLLGLSLCNIKINIKKALWIAAIQAVVALIVRYAVSYDIFGFGIHTLVQVGSFCMILSHIMKIKLYKAVIPILIGTLIDGILSFTINSGIDAIYEINFYLQNVKFVPTFMLWLPVKIVALILVLIIRKTNFILCNIDGEGELLGK